MRLCWCSGDGPRKQGQSIFRRCIATSAWVGKAGPIPSSQPAKMQCKLSCTFPMTVSTLEGGNGSSDGPFCLRGNSATVSKSTSGKGKAVTSSISRRVLGGRHIRVGDLWQSFQLIVMEVLPAKFKMLNELPATDMIVQASSMTATLARSACAAMAWPWMQAYHLPRSIRQKSAEVVSREGRSVPVSSANF